MSENLGMMFPQSASGTGIEFGSENTMSQKKYFPKASVMDKSRHQQDLFRPSLKRPVPWAYPGRPRTTSDLYANLVASAMPELNDPRELPLARVYIISRDAESFINRQKNYLRFRRDIFTISDRASEYLSTKGIKAKISVSLFTYAEYEDWVEPKIRIEVPADELASTYSVYDQLLSYCFKGIRKRTMKQLFVAIESM
jgi:hypothetical protein